MGNEESLENVGWLFLFLFFQSLWDKLFFWQKVPGSIPVEPSKFRILNPAIIREAALDLLHYPKPKPRHWGWDQVNVPSTWSGVLHLLKY